MLSDAQSSTVTEPRIAAACPLCGSDAARVFWSADDLPVFCNVLWPTRREATGAATAPARLAYCEDCTGIYNVAFDPRLVEYEGSYENSLHFSPRFQQYARQLVSRLVDRYDLKNKNVVEIGCGDGEFLRLICRAGNNRGFGFDPSYTPPPVPASDEMLTIAAELFSDFETIPAADLICCRHVLEHVADPLAMLRHVRQAIGPRDVAVYFEVPNALFTIEDLGVWDIIYEHCTYFSAAALDRLFRRAGFAPIEVREEFGGQFLAIEARPRPDDQPIEQDERKHASLSERIDRFREAYQAKITCWRDNIDALKQRAAKAVVWGGGSKGVTFLNVLKVPLEVVPYVVDVNPRKTGRFVPGTGQQVVSPEMCFREFRPEKVIVMNPLYREEIAETLSRMRVHAELIVA